MDHMCEGPYWGVKGEGLRHLASRCSAWGGGGRVAVAPRARARLVGVFGGHVLARLLSSTGLNLSHEAPQAILPQLLTVRTTRPTRLCNNSNVQHQYRQHDCSALTCQLRLIFALVGLSALSGFLFFRLRRGFGEK